MPAFTVVANLESTRRYGGLRRRLTAASIGC